MHRLLSLYLVKLYPCRRHKRKEKEKKLRYLVTGVIQYRP